MASLMLVNPRKRRAKKRTTSKRKSPSRGLATVRTTSVRRYRRNPIKGGKVMDTVQKGAVGAAGALAVDIAMQKLPMIPANLKTGPVGAVTQGFVGIGIGMLVAKFGKNRKLGAQLADGAVTVAAYNAAKSMIGPQLGLNDGELLGDDSLMYYNDSDLSYFDENESMDYYSASPVFDDSEY